MLCLIGLSLQAEAQAYRWLDPESGKLVISDEAPPANAKAVRKIEEPETNPGGRSYATRLAAENYPVTLYTSPDCLDLCKEARALLKLRGTPFTEKMISTAEDFEEARQLFGDAFIPSLRIGQQSIRGFLPASYNNLLDLAGYPAEASPDSKPSGGLPK
jgi:glutaredoxin